MLEATWTMIVFWITASVGGGLLLAAGYVVGSARWKRRLEAYEKRVRMEAPRRYAELRRMLETDGVTFGPES